MSKKTVPIVGIIAEDYCDVDSIRVLIHRIAKNSRIGIRQFVGKGCGKIMRKCHAWSRQLKQKGCTLLILIHDLDRNTLTDLRGKIRSALNPCSINNHLICIPVQELEAWLLSDPAAIKAAMNIRKVPNVTGRPENINSPKEYLGQIIYRASNGEKIYLNTKHNEKISEELSISKAVKRCPSFVPFNNFVQEHLLK
jgi:hypothetical protein